MAATSDAARSGIPLPATIGQETSARSSSRRDLTVFLITFGPGDAVYERFGHNAIWIHDEAGGTDVAYHYGIFDFEQENFVLRLIRGHMLYRMGGFPVDPLVDFYVEANRSVHVQRLAFTPRQAAELQRFLQWNDQPGNRFYRYDYYRDNCSTRIRDALDAALGGAIQRRLASMPTETSYRSHTQRLTARSILPWTGLLLALGQPVDQRLSAWEEAFIPMKLRERLRLVTVAGPDGSPRPLVAAERTLYTATRPPVRAGPPDRILAYLLLGLLVGGTLAVLARIAAKPAGDVEQGGTDDVRRAHQAERAAMGARRQPSRRAAHWGYLTIAVLWCLVAGIFGTLISSLWAFTDHVFTYHNENLLQINPLPLALVILLPLALTGRRRAGRWARIAAGVVAGLALLGALLQLLPGLDQTNGEIIAIALPVHLGLAYAVWHATDHRRKTTS